MAIASLSRRLMYQRAFDEIADHGVILTIMTIDRVALSRVVAIANGKGGVGKTSLATTLAGLAAKAGYEILLIDLDPRGTSAKTSVTPVPDSAMTAWDWSPHLPAASVFK